MKANRKFLHGEDEAVSPVIAVILMVAITVVLAATVYVWVSGFGSQSSQPAKTMSLTSAGTIATAQNLDGVDADDTYKAYTVAAATSGMRYGDITVTLNGNTAAMSAGNCDSTLTDIVTTASTPKFIACPNAFGGSSSTARTSTSTISAGDYFYIALEGGSVSSQTLRILDAQANSVILTLTVG